MSRAVRNIITSAGATLISRSIAGGKVITFTEAKVGVGKVDDETEYEDGTDEYEEYLHAKTSLISNLGRATITRKSSTDSSCSFYVRFSNTDLHIQTRTEIDEVGIWAKIEGDAQSILFAYMTFGDQTDVILPETVVTTTREYIVSYDFDGTDAQVSVQIGDIVYKDDIVNSLTETDADKPLSANMGKTLDDKKVNKTDVVNDLASGGTTKVLSAEQGKALNTNKIEKSDIVNNLISGGTTKVLSAEQGKTLNTNKVDKADIVNNLTSGGATKVLSAEQGKELNNKKLEASALIDMIYPVGSIYMSVSSVSPQTFLGGTWQRLSDTFLLAAGSQHQPGATGGAESVSYTPTGSVGSHTLTESEMPSHTHSIGAHAHSLNSHTHSVPAHAHGLNGHTHSYTDYYADGSTGSTTLTVNEMPSHNHWTISTRYGVYVDGASSSTKYRVPSITETSATVSPKTEAVGGGAGHTHTVSNTSASRTTGGNSGSTANSAALTSGAASGNTGNSASYNSGSAGSSGSHNHGFTGTQSTISTMPPYTAVYMWTRTA